MEYKELYYLINADHNLKVIGNYPQVSLNKGYNPNNNGHWKVPHNSFPNFNPNLELTLHEKAFDTDYLHFSDLKNGFIVSDKLREILSSFTLPNHKFYPINVFYNKKRLNYYWFYYTLKDFWNVLDLENSYAELINADNVFSIEKKIAILSKQQILDKQIKYKFPYNLRTGKITLQKGTPKYDFYQIQCLGYQKVFSERLINCLNDEKVTGFELTAYDKFEIMD